MSKDVKLVIFLSISKKFLKDIIIKIQLSEIIIKIQLSEIIENRNLIKV